MYRNSDLDILIAELRTFSKIFFVFFYKIEKLITTTSSKIVNNSEKSLKLNCIKNTHSTLAKIVSDLLRQASSNKFLDNFLKFFRKLFILKRFQCIEMSNLLKNFSKVSKNFQVKPKQLLLTSNLSKIDLKEQKKIIYHVLSKK